MRLGLFTGRWFRDKDSATAKCNQCGAVALKSEMVWDHVHGWFCSEEEYREFERGNQW